MTPTNVARAMAAWCGARELDGAQIVHFYKEDDNYQKVVQAAKAPGLSKGLRSFIAMHNKLLTYRMEGTVLYMKAHFEAIDFMTTLSEMLDTIRLSAEDDRMAAIQNVLEPLKGGESMRQFALKVKEAGVCLKDGNMYGGSRQLRAKLNQRIHNRYPLRVSKADAKQYPLVKKCLVMCH